MPPEPKAGTSVSTGIWSASSNYNTDRRRFKIITGCFYITLRDTTIAPNDVQNHVTKMKNWKALGSDVVQGFWFKGISNLHEAIVKPLKASLVSGKVSPWMTKRQMMDHGKQRISH